MLVTLLLFGLGALAEGFKVEDSKITYVTKIITAENVKGVEFRLSRVVARNDCNTMGMPLTKVLVSGDSDGLYATYFFYAGAGIVQTQKYCPLKEPVIETIYSNPVFIKSFTNEHINGKVVVSVVIPTGYKLEVVEVK